MTTPLKIEAGKFYRTLDGSKAFIYTISAKGSHPIHGSVSGPVADDLCAWMPNGTQSESKLEIVSEWVETPVAKFWPDFKWQAMDEGRAWFAYIDKPIFMHGKWMNGTAAVILSRSQEPTFTGKPKDSLIERKAGE